jgi:hypothetical protein
MEGGFFLRKKPLETMDSVKTRIENAVFFQPEMEIHCQNSLR